MFAAIAAHFVLAMFAPLLVRALGRRAFFLLALAPAATTAYVLAHAPSALAKAPVIESVSWIPQFDMTLTLLLDPLAWLFMLIVSGIGTLIFLYCGFYFKNTEPGLQRFAGVFLAFAGAMAGLVLADDAMLLFIFWELTTVFSYLLIGHYVTKQASRRAAMNALISTTIGGLAMMVGLLMLGRQAGTLRISEIVTSSAFAEATPFIVVALVLVAIGAATKSALVPGHFWLPGAMAAPTPVSAYLHAAAMVKAGIYLLLRFAPVFSAVSVLTIVISAFGIATMILGGWRALRQFDIKLLLAYGTVSQLGFMAAIAGMATPEAVFAASALVLSHALFKAPLFMVVGIIDKAYGTRDVRELRGVGRDMPVVAVIALVSAASMAAVPVFFGFIAKEAVFYAMYEGEVWQQVMFAGAVVGSILTVAYACRFFFQVFPGQPTLPHKRPSVGFVLAPGLVALASLAAIAAVGPLDALMALIARGAHAAQVAIGLATAGPIDPGHLVILPTSLSIPFLASLTALAVGGLAAYFHRPVESFQKAVSPQSHPWGHKVDAERGFRAFMRGIDLVSVHTTAIFQRGSLPFNVGTIFLVMIALSTAILMFQPTLPANIVLYQHPAEVAVLAFAVLAALGAARARRRLRAALLISGTGFAVALLFMLYGAPDVAGTQLFVETIMTVVLILVLRRLPVHFSIRPLRRDQWVRWGIAILTAVTTVVVVAYAAGSRNSDPVGPDLIEAGYEIGKGHNTVNVALVDARVWDTMGEIGVLLVVASGVASLVFVSRRERAIVRVSELTKNTSIWRRKDYENLPVNAVTFHDEGEDLEGYRGRTWISAGATLAPERRMVILEVITRIAFPLLIMFSIYLLIAGHNLPGGGFAGGLVGGLAITLRYLAGGRYELNEAAPVQAGALLGTGMVLAVLTGITPLLFGGTVFQSYVWIDTLPILGEVELASALVFDIGVYLIVIGLVLDFLRTLGEQIDRHQEAELDAR
ncbi:MAG: Na+/H+ antiporter subunit A [Dermabacter sp.]|nr:Na+/H+ antiporter subunit A [Dermabacter sp.]